MLLINGADGAGSGWKYGCRRRGQGCKQGVDVVRQTYRLGLDQAHVVVPGVKAVVLVNDSMLACQTLSGMRRSRVLQLLTGRSDHPDGTL